ncbi:MAG: mitochondrial fission ELM1 family protein [bacterium]|nr:mitochondrial fission ELM1 family protein [bacterium]
MQPEVRVVIASDGKRGHENQSRVLARMLGDTEPLVMHLRNPEGGWGETLLRAAFALRGKWRMPKRSAGERVRELMRPESPAAFRDFSAEIGRNRDAYRIFTVSTGTPPATGNLLLSCLLDAEALCVMTPSMLPKRLFKLMIVPQHDARYKVPENVIVHPLALSYHDHARANQVAREVKDQANFNCETKYLVLAIGNISDFPNPSEFVLTAVREIAREYGYKLLLTTSRRTHAVHLEAIKEVLISSEGLVAHFVDAAKDSMNPLPGYFEFAERVIITSDSYSMVGEAIQAGHQPIVCMYDRERTKLRKALAALKQQSLIKMLDTTNFDGNVGLLNGYRADWAGTPGRIFEPNRFYNELRAEVRSRLGLD